MVKREFTTAEITYLRGLSAVSTVTPTRIIYSEKFKRRFIREHRNGKRGYVKTEVETSVG
ncbi:hypothetical protein [Bifidobacterium adolescentis]|uniref:hypothetical protein n=1 Tax=Bifidobacterium adolescentis TaxID=1680 RepID=UPI0040638E4B